MPLIADSPTPTPRITPRPPIVIERPTLQTEEGRALVNGILSAFADLSVVGNGATSVRPEMERFLGTPAQVEHSRARFVVGTQPAGEDASWMSLALRTFPDSRYMTREERAEFDAMSRTEVQPLSKPLKKFTSY